MSILGKQASARPAKRSGAAEIAAFVTDGETENALRLLVQEQVMTFTVVRRGSVRDAIAYLGTAAPPRVLIVDVSGSRLPLSDIDELASACEPGVVVIVLGQQNDIGLFRDLMHLGIADYLVKPVTTEWLRRSISIGLGGQSGSAMRQRTGKIIAVTGARGGVGTSTVMTNVGWLLANKIGRNVALVDLDLQCGAISLMLGLKRQTGMMEALKNAHRIDNIFLDRTLVHHGERLSVLSAEEPLGDDTHYEPQALDQVIKVLEQRHHYVLFDVPRRPDPVYQHLLSRAQVRVVVANPTIASIRDVMRILKLAGRDDIGQRLLVVLNHTAPPSQADISRRDFEKAVGRRVDFEIPFTRHAMFADNSGKLLAQRRCTATDQLMRITDDLTGRRAVQRFSLARLFGR
ncbi:AAA family ATPase [Azospirillum picis]|uniref:Pilus assembly protein CpaE n=1 Tax=Azospirillum picis TaxID=488438 RepID=A0ABU0MN80_9PROT|nr:cellulose synthase operon protein YhjQ/BcsQ [Azospirillum picis]MBP2301111.1 pilus assembly protein CpaE [Azospirillum picis]MDQ0534927.1 pilus assembly protein CpaE [Azospirillum picis]